MTDQFFSGLLVPQHDGTRGPIEALEEHPLRLPFFVGARESPRDRIGIHPEVLEELEVLILDVLGLVRWDTRVREEPLEVSRSVTIESQLHVRSHEGGDQAGLEVHL